MKMGEESTSSEGYIFVKTQICFALFGIVSSTCSLYFILRKLKINHVIKKLLLFASVNQIFGYGILFGSLLIQFYQIKNKVTCFLAINAWGLTMKGTQTVISMISIIRYWNMKSILSFEKFRDFTRYMRSPKSLFSIL